eukprot:TRINITY_DN2024_c0_g1_i1.p2 TRINITY_DN2024_c0_g1~~TRINITY_DN2024_c0_g1_i1.p2  ORF type:complete len:206 (+),score=2.38 TRINITY_DN2024_c0_g1_i1:39-620(+)
MDLQLLPSNWQVHFLEEVFKKLDAKTQLVASLVCRSWQRTTVKVQHQVVQALSAKLSPKTWGGDYTQDGSKDPMKFTALELSDVCQFNPSYKLTGAGSDFCGNFTIDGRLDIRQRMVQFTKKYSTKHGSWSWLYRGDLTWNQNGYEYLISGKWGLESQMKNKEMKVGDDCDWGIDNFQITCPYFQPERKLLHN